MSDRPEIVRLQSASMLHFNPRVDDSELVIEESCLRQIISVAAEIEKTVPFLPFCEPVEAIIYGADPDTDGEPATCYHIPSTDRFVTSAGELVGPGDTVAHIDILGTLDEFPRITAGLQQMRDVK